MQNSILDDKWYQRVWLPFAAATYIVICIFDFIVMPLYVTAHNSRIENAVFRSLDSKDAAAFAEGLVKVNQAQRQWNPLTLIGGGFLHVSFGALLTGGVVTRGVAKKSEIENYRYVGGNQEVMVAAPQYAMYPMQQQPTFQTQQWNNGPPAARTDHNSGPMPKAE